MERYIFIIVLLACCLWPVRCYSSGKVTGACDNMTPQHKKGAQQSPAPFSVTTDRFSFKEGDEIIGETSCSFLYYWRVHAEILNPHH